MGTFGTIKVVLPPINAFTENCGLISVLLYLTNLIIS